MATGFVLEVDERKLGKSISGKIRRNGLVPGVLYGAHGESAPIQVSAQALQKALNRGGGHQPFLVQKGKERQRPMALIKEIQRDLFTRFPVHVDLLTIAMDKPVATEVPIVVHGESDLARRNLLLQQQVRTLAVEALPEALPESFEISVGGLEAGAAITAADMQVPPGVTVTADPAQVILSIAEQRVVAEPEEAEVPPVAEEEEEKDEAAR